MTQNANVTAATIMLRNKTIHLDGTLQLGSLTVKWTCIQSILHTYHKSDKGFFDHHWLIAHTVHELRGSSKVSALKIHALVACWAYRLINTKGSFTRQAYFLVVVQAP